MTTRFTQWWIMTGSVFVLMFLAVMLSRTLTYALDWLLHPWFLFCEAITPQVWQTKGNMLLGMMWLLSGIIAYSATTGALIVAGLSFSDRIRKQRSTYAGLSDEHTLERSKS